MAQFDVPPAVMASMPDEQGSQTLLAYYSAIERASDNMLAAARNGDWDQVVRLEGACAVLISQLQQASRALELSPEDVRSKRQMMLRILDNDAQIRRLTEPWLDDLERLLAGQTKNILH